MPSTNIRNNAEGRRVGYCHPRCRFASRRPFAPRRSAMPHRPEVAKVGCGKSVRRHGTADGGWEIERVDAARSARSPRDVRPRSRIPGRSVRGWALDGGHGILHRAGALYPQRASCPRLTRADRGLSLPRPPGDVAPRNAIPQEPGGRSPPASETHAAPSSRRGVSARPEDKAGHASDPRRERHDKDLCRRRHPTAGRLISAVFRGDPARTDRSTTPVDAREATGESPVPSRPRGSPGPRHPAQRRARLGRNGPQRCPHAPPGPRPMQSRKSAQALQFGGHRV